MATCSKENTDLFFTYIQGELSREQEHLIDLHIQGCQHCLLCFAYIETILMQIHTPNDKKALLLSYLSEPIFHHHLHSLQQELLTNLKDFHSQHLPQDIRLSLSLESAIGKELLKIFAEKAEVFVSK